MFYEYLSIVEKCCMAKFGRVGKHFWIWGYCVSTVRLNEEQIRNYNRERENLDKQQMELKFVERGVQLLSKSGVDLVFVLGYPEYYTRHGFTPAGHLGFEAPYPIPDEHADAWMVQALRPDVISSVCGKVMCSDTLNKPEYWRE